MLRIVVVGEKSLSAAVAHGYRGAPVRCYGAAMMVIRKIAFRPEHSLDRYFGFRFSR
jgi:hypothetical protein